jgi:hypothetical protein
MRLPLLLWIGIAAAIVGSIGISRRRRYRAVAVITDVSWWLAVASGVLFGWIYMILPKLVQRYPLGKYEYFHPIFTYCVEAALLPLALVIYCRFRRQSATVCAYVFALGWLMAITAGLIAAPAITMGRFMLAGWVKPSGVELPGVFSSPIPVYVSQLGAVTVLQALVVRRVTRGFRTDAPAQQSM